ncbi:hypothetical protein [Burkholderia glumae]|nr:hypothetical protein [Burkholderia glumae]
MDEFLRGIEAAASPPASRPRTSGLIRPRSLIAQHPDFIET